MVKDLTNFVRPFVYGEPPFPVCEDSLYILKHILPEQIFVIVFAICVDCSNGSYTTLGH